MKRFTKLAILGGSFNPVHMGHLFLADSVLTCLDYDRIVFVPAFESPFKIGAEGASPDDRMEMLAASIAGDPRLTIDDCEIRRQGVSYTIDTLKDIIARYRPEGKPGLILGDDLVSTFYKWRNPGEIAELADIIIARRTGAESAGPQPEPGQALAACSAESAIGEDVNVRVNFPYPFRALCNEIINVSSRLVREKINSAEAWRFLVPSGARYIIQDRRLYGYNDERKPEEYANVFIKDNVFPVLKKKPAGFMDLVVRIENDVRTALDSVRFVHSRNTALLSWDLCRHFGLDFQRGYLAGIAHDMCKFMSSEDLIRLVHADGKSISKLEQKKPSLLHARAAAVLLKKKYGIKDTDVLDAVRYHTTGSKDMCSLAKVVYVADKIEVSRDDVDPVLRKMSYTSDLDTLFAAVLDDTVAYLRSRHQDISYGTRRLLLAMQKRNWNEKS